MINFVELCRINVSESESPPTPRWLKWDLKKSELIAIICQWIVSASEKQITLFSYFQNNKPRKFYTEILFSQKPANLIKKISSDKKVSDLVEQVRISSIRFCGYLPVQVAAIDFTPASPHRPQHSLLDITYKTPNNHKSTLYLKILWCQRHQRIFRYRVDSKPSAKSLIFCWLF